MNRILESQGRTSRVFLVTDWRRLCETAVLAVALVATMVASGSDFTSRITWDTLSLFCHSNVANGAVDVEALKAELRMRGCVVDKAALPVVRPRIDPTK